MSNISPKSQTDQNDQNDQNDKDKDKDKDNENNQNVFPIPPIENDVSNDSNDSNDNNEDNNETQFSKNSIINISRKAGVKCISQCGIDKTRTILHNKIKEMSEKLVFFYTSRNGKTITKKMVLDFLESEQIHITHLTSFA